MYTAYRVDYRKEADMSGRRLVVGDIHGSYKALMEVLDKASFSPEDDTLYFTGDVSDGYRDVYECLTFLRSLPHFRPVIGNHDVWLQRWLLAGYEPLIWTRQGGMSTIASFERNGVGDDEKKDIGEWLRTWPFVVVEPDFIMIHGGPGLILSEEDLEEISRIERAGIEYSEDNWNGWLKTRQAFVQWDRDYLRIAEYDNEDDTPMVTKYRGEKRLIIGHTEMRNHKPYISRKYNLVNVDTGAGSFGRLTLMDIDSGKTWQSRKSMKLYGYCSIG